MTNATTDKLIVEDGEIRFVDADGGENWLYVLDGTLWFVCRKDGRYMPPSLNQPLAAQLAPILAHFARTGRLENPPPLDRETLGRIVCEQWRRAKGPHVTPFDECGDIVREWYCDFGVQLADYVRSQLGYQESLCRECGSPVGSVLVSCAPVAPAPAQPEPPNVVTFTASDFDNYDAPAQPEPELDREWCGRELAAPMAIWHQMVDSERNEFCDHAVAFARAVLARYGQRAPQGVVEALRRLVRRTGQRDNSHKSDCDCIFCEKWRDAWTNAQAALSGLPETEREDWKAK